MAPAEGALNFVLIFVRVTMHLEPEWLTRKNRIDSKLRSLDPVWKSVRYQDGMDLSRLDCHAVEEFPTANGPADYALFVAGRLLGIIEVRYQKARAHVDKLTQSILAKEFRGELVPKDPNDEPADVLLERIRKESEKEGKCVMQTRQS